MGFEIHDLEGKFLKTFKTRDIVLQRIMRYAKAVGTRYFWIDQECFDQENAEERQAAMDSMDLVYKRSDHPVALLEMTLDSCQVGLMSLLMSFDEVRASKVDSMMNMLKDVHQDRWWTRAWTLHEEYLARPHLELLIRHNSAKGDYIESKLTRIEGEVCVSASAFQRRATYFLQHQEAVFNPSRDMSNVLLRTFHKVDLRRVTTGSSKARTMSSSIFEDLERRNMSEGYDFITIAANVCNYPVRLHSNRLAKSSHSVGLCALTMYLLNGEIFYNDRRSTVQPNGMGLSEFLTCISFGQFVLGSSVDRLWWLQECRLWPVRFSKEGVITSGLLWHVHTKIETFNWGEAPWDEKWDGPRRLPQLSEKLRLLDNCDRLSFQLELLDQCLNENEEQPYPLERENTYRYLMAEELMEAIRCGKSLYLATLEGLSETSAIFIEGTGDEATDSGTVVNSGGDAEHLLRAAVNFSVFTSWSRAHHVSMTVKVAEADSESKPPLMTITGWTNGLAFHDGVSQRKDLVVRWPEAWKQREA